MRGADRPRPCLEPPCFGQGKACAATGSCIGLMAGFLRGSFCRRRRSPVLRPDGRVPSAPHPAPARQGHRPTGPRPPPKAVAWQVARSPPGEEASGRIDGICQWAGRCPAHGLRADAAWMRPTTVPHPEHQVRSRPDAVAPTLPERIREAGCAEPRRPDLRPPSRGTGLWPCLAGCTLSRLGLAGPLRPDGLEDRRWQRMRRCSGHRRSVSGLAGSSSRRRSPGRASWRWPLRSLPSPASCSSR